MPFDAIALADQPITLGIVRPDGTVRYQALILAKDGLLESALDTEQRAALTASSAILGCSDSRRTRIQALRMD